MRSNGVRFFFFAGSFGDSCHGTLDWYATACTWVEEKPGSTTDARGEWLNVPVVSAIPSRRVLEEPRAAKKRHGGRKRARARREGAREERREDIFYLFLSPSLPFSLLGEESFGTRQSVHVRCRKRYRKTPFLPAGSSPPVARRNNSSRTRRSFPSQRETRVSPRVCARVAEDPAEIDHLATIAASIIAVRDFRWRYRGRTEPLDQRLFRRGPTSDRTR